MRKLNLFITLIFIIIYFYSCDKQVIPLDAEITNIYNITDLPLIWTLK